MSLVTRSVFSISYCILDVVCSVLGIGYSIFNIIYPQLIWNRGFLRTTVSLRYQLSTGKIGHRVLYRLHEIFGSSVCVQCIISDI